MESLSVTSISQMPQRNMRKALYNKSITVLEKNKDEYNLAVNYNNLGDCYIHLKQYDKKSKNYL
jgi:hypothetical protein